MKNNVLFKHLIALETSLHKVEVRSDFQVVDKLLHDDYIEFGISGETYNKSQVLRHLQDSKNDLKILSSDFKCKILEDNVILITYKSAYLNANHEATQHGLRSSIWQNTELGWRLLFHQGTPCKDKLK